MRLFISYRRADGAYAAARLREHLLQKLQVQTTFLDVLSIPPATDFGEAIRTALSDCDAVLALLSPQWLRANHNPAALENERAHEDFVYLEIELALSAGVPIVPVLLEGAAMPSATDLPGAIRSFARLNAVPLRTDPYFAADVGQLVATLHDIAEIDVFVRPFPGLVVGVTSETYMQSQARLDLEVRFIKGRQPTTDFSQPTFTATSVAGVITEVRLSGGGAVEEWARAARTNTSVASMRQLLQDCGYECREQLTTTPVLFRVWNALRHGDFSNYSGLDLKATRITRGDVHLTVLARYVASAPKGTFHLIDLLVQAEQTGRSFHLS